MERELFVYMEEELMKDQQRLKDQIKAQIQERYADQQRLMQERHTVQLNDAQRSPAYGHGDQRQSIIDQTIADQQRQQEELQAKIRVEQEALYEERNKRLEGIYFEDYGGSLESAHGMVTKYEEERQQQASNEFSAQWEKEDQIQTYYEGAKEMRESEYSLASEFNDSAPPPPTIGGEGTEIDI